jgi:alcohol dehydrogenase YqhD (iron-dependent ADH family)
VAHGAGLAIVFPAWMKYVYKRLSEKFLQFAVRVWDVDQRFDDPERTIKEGIARMETFFINLGLPVRLGEIGINKNHFDEIVEKCLLGRGNSIGGVIRLDRNDIYHILELADGS